MYLKTLLKVVNCQIMMLSHPVNTEQTQLGRTLSDFEHFFHKNISSLCIPSMCHTGIFKEKSKNRDLLACLLTCEVMPTLWRQNLGKVSNFDNAHTPMKFHFSLQFGSKYEFLVKWGSKSPNLLPLDPQ